MYSHFSNHKPKKRHLVYWIDSVLYKSRWQQFGILVGLFLFASIIIYAVGVWWFPDIGDPNKPKVSRYLMLFYLLIDTNALNNVYMRVNSTWTLLFSVMVYIVGAVIFSGMLISIVSNWVTRRVENFRNGLTHYLVSGHTVILGYDDMIPSILEHVFAKNPQKDVLIMSSIKAETIREKITRTASSRFLPKIVINYGHRTSKESLKNIHLENAEEIFIVGNRTLPFHDAMNMECLQAVEDYFNIIKRDHSQSSLPQKITCVFEDFDTFEAFKSTDVFEDFNKMGIIITPYNFYSGWANLVFVSGQYKKGENVYAYPLLEGNGIGDTDNHRVHLIFVGISTFSVSFAMEAAHLLHFPNFLRDEQMKTDITFIDINADTEMNLFLTRNRHFFEIQGCRYMNLSEQDEADWKIIPPTHFSGEDADFLDIRFNFVKGDIFSPIVQKRICEWAEDDTQLPNIFLAMSDQRKNFAIGMNLPDVIYQQQIPVFIRQDRSDNFVTNLRIASLKKSRRYAHIYPFGMTDIDFQPDEKTLTRAQLINYLYATAYFEVMTFKSVQELEQIKKESILEDAYDKWLKLSVALRWSNIYCASTIPYKMRALRKMRGLDINDCSHDQDEITYEEASMLGEMEHNRWNVEKLLLGFRKPKSGENHDKKNFIHSDIRPFSQLGLIKNLDLEICKLMPWIIKMSDNQEI